MLDYNKLDGSALAKIINDRETVVIMVAQNITNTVGEIKNQWLKFSLPNIPDEELNRIRVTTILNGTDTTSMWNGFILIAYNLGANIRYKNTNDIDCIVEISF